MTLNKGYSKSKEKHWFVVKSGVHAADYQTCAPQLGSLKQKCSRQNILMPSLKLPSWGAHTRGTFEHAHFGGSCPPLGLYCLDCLD